MKRLPLDATALAIAAVACSQPDLAVVRTDPFPIRIEADAAQLLDVEAVLDLDVPSERVEAVCAGIRLGLQIQLIGADATLGIDADFDERDSPIDKELVDDLFVDLGLTADFSVDEGGRCSVTGQLELASSVGVTADLAVIGRASVGPVAEELQPGEDASMVFEVSPVRWQVVERGTEYCGFGSCNDRGAFGDSCGFDDQCESGLLCNATRTRVECDLFNGCFGAFNRCTVGGTCEQFGFRGEPCLLNTDCRSNSCSFFTCD